MDKHDIEYVKASHNIVDLIGGYIKLKRNGKNFTGLCPFHSEKTPSFTVDESKQFYHCFGCGASGDVIKFVMEYSGLEFIEAYKQLGGEVDLMPSSQVIKNIKNAEKISRFRHPDDHKEDGELANRYISKCLHENVSGIDFFKYKGGYMLPIYNADFELVNAVNFRHGERMSFIAGGVSYGCFTPIRINDTNKWIACVALANGRIIAHEKQVNVAVCWDSHSMKYLCKWNYGDMKIWPAIRDCDDDYLCYEMNWIKIKDNNDLEKMKCLN